MVRILLKFSADITDQPLTSSVILEEKVPINILTAHIDQKGGEILVEVPEEEAERVIQAFEKRKVEVEISKPITVDQDLCTDCGACFSLCPVTAISVDEERKVAFDENRCLGSSCSLCVDACPTRAISLRR